MATNKKNKVKFGLQNVYWAKINEWGEDPDGNKTVPAYGPSKHLPGAVSLSIDANGESENFYADNQDMEDDPEGYIYVDATEYGANRPVYVNIENAEIKKL